RARPVIGFPFVSRTVVVRFCATPCVTTPEVEPLASVTPIEAGGQVEKYPADDPDPAIDAVIAVVPGCCAVIWLFVALIEATEAVPTVKLKVPIEDSHDGTEVTPGGSAHA